MSDALLNDLRGKLTEELWRTSVNSGNMSDVTAAIDALIKAHIAAVRNDWLRSAGVVVKP